MADTLSRLVVQIGGDTAGLKKSLGDAEKSTSSFGSKLGGLGKTAAVGLAGAGVAVAGIGAVMGKVGFDFLAMKEQAQIAFTTMLGDGGKARAFLGELQTFAAKTPFEFPELTRAAQKMMAMGFAADDVIPTLTAIGDAVAGLGGSSAEVDRVTTALGQIQAKGKASAEEMMQLTEAGIPAWQMLADKIGVSVPEAMDLVSKGAVDAGTTIDAVVEGMNSRFGGMMAKQSETFGGLLSTLKDTFSQISGTVMAPFFEMATNGMQKLAALTSGEGFQQGVQAFAAGMAEAMSKVGAFVSEVGPKIVSALVTVWDEVMPKVKIAMDAVQTAITAVTGYIEQKWPPIRDVLMQTWNDIVPVVERVKGDIERVVDFVVGVVRDKWPQIRETAEEIMAAVGKAIAGIMEEIGPTLDAIVSHIERIVQEIAERWGQIEPVIRPIWDAIVQLIQIALDTISNAVQLVMNIIQGDWEGAWNNVKTIASNLWEAIKVVVSAAADAIPALLRLAWGVLEDIASAAWNLVKRAIDAAWEEIKTSIGNAVDAAVKLVAALPGKAVDALGSLGRMLYNKGLELVQGFIDGLVDKAKDVPGVVANLAQSAINAFNPFSKSPWPATIEIGSDFSQGFIDGILSKRGAVDDAITQMAEMTIDALGRAIDEHNEELSRGAAVVGWFDEAITEAIPNAVDFMHAIGEVTFTVGSFASEGSFAVETANDLADALGSVGDSAMSAGAAVAAAQEIISNGFGGSVGAGGIPAGGTGGPPGDPSRGAAAAMSNPDTSGDTKSLMQNLELVFATQRNATMAAQADELIRRMQQDAINRTLAMQAAIPGPIPTGPNGFVAGPGGVVVNVNMGDNTVIAGDRAMDDLTEEIGRRTGQKIEAALAGLRWR